MLLAGITEPEGSAERWSSAAARKKEGLVPAGFNLGANFPLSSFSLQQPHLLRPQGLNPNDPQERSTKRRTEYKAGSSAYRAWPKHPNSGRQELRCFLLPSRRDNRQSHWKSFEQRSK
jgi:hypothetical protein